MFRKNPVDRAIASLQSRFEQMELNKFPTNKQLIVPKLSEDITQIFELLYGTVDAEPSSKHIEQLLPKLIDSKHNFFLKLLKYRTYFSFETKLCIAKILSFVIENGEKYGVSQYIKQQTNLKNGQNKIIDLLFKHIRHHPGGVFLILQEMAKRSELRSTLLNEITVRWSERRRTKSNAYKSFHQKAQSFPNGNHLNHAVPPSKPTKATSKSRRSSTITADSNHQNGSKRGGRRRRAQTMQRLDTIQQHQQLHIKSNTSPSNILSTNECINGLLLDDDCKQQTISSTTQSSSSLISPESQSPALKKGASLVEALFDLAKLPDLQISWDAFKTLRYLFCAQTRGTVQDRDEDVVAAYLRQNTDVVFAKFNELMHSDNAVNSRLFLNLLKELLAKRSHLDILMRYITKKDHLAIAAKLLTDKLVISLTDQKRHNLLIDLLLEEYFEEAGDILQELASRPSLADLLLNHTFITRLYEAEQLDINDLRRKVAAIKQSSLTPTRMQALNQQLKRESSALTDCKSLSEPSILSTANSSLSLPSLAVMTSASSLSSNGGRMRTQSPCFRRSPQNSNPFKRSKQTEDKEEEKQDVLEHEHEHEEVERPLVLELISLINRSCSESVTNYSFNVLRLLLTTNREKAAIFLVQYYDELIVQFRQMIRVENSNRLRQEQFLELLTELLLENANGKFRRRFKSQVVNLQIIMNLLKSRCEVVAYDALHVFAVFVSSRRMARDIHVILWKNVKQNNLIQFIERLLPNACKKYDGLKEEKIIVVEHLKQLPTPKIDDESYRQLPLK
eukprot:CAMPEP_0197029378 /NCGR_PEP_ID=MMETSP1384-20130603/8832_1 /TAXON_ID=29189 /ORGANISM="Ammonia sp." /LENGTH=789 /DNA_ID=CAMNT_0042458525 /DNA_START=61 /DNA_END=2430 /DNA_ORIENTATION=+